MSKLKQLLHRIATSWATRSLAVGAVATAVDVVIGNLLVFGLHLSTAVAAMIALAVGSTLNFLGQRRFAFNERKMATPVMRWVLMTALQIPVHGQLVHVFRDWWGVPFTFAKMGGDVIVFGVLQLVMLRYLVFPKTPEEEAAAARIG
ncbi:MAG: GtrA family protein [Archangiaceae bacterium]|nr:GtrA family protein [Archangiaceae bacterium]